MRKFLMLSVLCVLCGGLFAGCGNVYLKGDALTAAQTSATDAYNAAIRGHKEPAAPLWMSAYLDENYLQWRSFVRSATKDTTWGPKLEGE